VGERLQEGFGPYYGAGRIRTVEPVVGVLVPLLASMFASGGVYAIVTGCRDEYRARRLGPSPDEIQLLAAIEEWLKQQH